MYGAAELNESVLLSRPGSAEDGRVWVGDLVERLSDGPRLQLQPRPLCTLLFRRFPEVCRSSAGTSLSVATLSSTSRSSASPPSVTGATAAASTPPSNVVIISITCKDRRADRQTGESADRRRQVSCSVWNL